MTKTIFIKIFLLVMTINLSLGQVNYTNNVYGFSGKVPADWYTYAHIKNDSVNRRAVMDWGLPKVYSEVELALIENAVSITAYKRNEIKDIDDLINLEFTRIEHILQSKELIKNSLYPSYLVMTKRNEIKYKTKVSFIFKNNIGYVLAFTATPGTYDINLPKFDVFVNNLKLFDPMVSQQVVKSNLRFDGLYVARSGEISRKERSNTYMYIKFYNDGSVFAQTLNSYDPKGVSQWFGKDGRFERKGLYNIEGSDITFSIAQYNQTQESQTEIYCGKVTDENKMFLELVSAKGSPKDLWFEFVKI